jgi:hypothetical protein
MEPLEPLESHVLFVRDDGQFEVGTIDQIDGQYLQRQSDNFFQPNWTHVVAVGPHILFVRDDGLFEVGHIDQFDNQYVQTQSGTWFQPYWTHVVAVGPHILFVRDGGLFEVGHIDLSTARYVQTDGGIAFGSGWTHVVAVGPHVLFVRDDGRVEVGHIDESPPRTYVPTGTGSLFAGVTHVVAACSRVFLSGPSQFVVGHIDPWVTPKVPPKVTSFVITQNPGPDVGGTPDTPHVVAVGPRVLSVSPTKTLGSVMHFNDLGQFVQTETGPDFASDWTHVVAVA